MAQNTDVQLRTSINSFTRDMYNVVAQSNAGKSVVMSPLSAEIALSLLSLGAKGSTQQELLTSLHLPSIDFTKKAFKDAMVGLNALSSEGVTLSIANKLFVKDGNNFKLNPTYKKDAIEVFQSDIQSLNFNANVEAANTINKWVEDKTNEKIKDLVKPDSLNADTRLVLVNAIYFKGNWKKSFDKQQTFKQDFHLSKTNSVKVDMMHMTAHFRYGEISDWNAKVLELPYKGDNTAMVIILPNEIDGLAALEQKLADKNQDTVSKIESSLRQVEVVVSLPKFRVETEMNLKQILPKLGINQIFSSAADLSGLLENNEPLFVSEAIQKAFIEVNEEGAEAAAATGVIRMRRSLPTDFICDHPFVLSIILLDHDVPLFISRIGGDESVFGKVQDLADEEIHDEL